MGTGMPTHWLVHKGLKAVSMPVKKIVQTCSNFKNKNCALARTLQKIAFLIYTSPFHKTI
jgi:hypothetical protein